MRDNISTLKKDECLGCRSCEQICPKKCISIFPDKEGFLYPTVDENICIKCELCTKHCPAIQKIEGKEPEAFLAVRLKDSSAIMDSSSGGIFAGLAEYIIENDGVVFGCAFNKNLEALHIKVDNCKDLQALKKSKYVTSNTLHTYSEVAQIIKNEPKKLILYTGTPCQIHGLYSFLGKKTENLFTADIICHGVPSQKLFDKYLEWLGKKQSGKILYYGFRDKDVAGWACAGKTKTKTKTKIINGATDPYYSSFMRGETYRQSCYKCPFANIKYRPADITMGDYWGIEFAHPKFYSKKGVSCCLINTEKGKDFFQKIAEKFDYLETSDEKITLLNGNLVHPTAKPAVRESIYDGIDEIPAEKFISRLYAPMYKRIVRYFISIIPHSVKTFLKRFKYGF